MTTATVTAVTTAATIVAAGAKAYDSYLAWDSARDAQEDAEKLGKKRQDQAADILTQIESEDIIYEDELDMIQKQSALAEDKLLGRTFGMLEQVGEQVSASLYQQPEKFEGGASQRERRKSRQALKETQTDIKEDFAMGKRELSLQDEMAERQALLRHDEIIGSLEAMGKELEEEPTTGRQWGDWKIGEETGWG